ncbi:protein phosphatase 1 regulatory subunit 3A [Lissotriton helveticus]
MEPSEETSPLAGDNLLEVPTLNEAYEDDEEVKVTFKPRFSPLPRRRSSVSSDDAECEAPSSVARKVSFADAFGLNLVSVKEFDTWEIPTTSQNDTFEDEDTVVDEFYLLSRFEVPSREEVLQKVHKQKVLLEVVEFLPGSASLSCIIRVLNVSFEKRVFVRMTLDDWLSYYDILAEYVPDSCDGETDQFSFRMSLVPPYLKDGAKLEFCIRYETSAGTFWANNHGNNYQLSCHKKETAKGADKEPEDVSDKFKKSCLKTSQSKEDEILTLSDDDTWNYSNLSDATIPQIVYPPEDDGEEIDESIDVKAMQHGGHNERELELLLSQHLIRIRDASSGDKKTLSASEHNHFSSDEQRCEQELTLEDTNTDLRQNSLNVCSFLKDILEDDKPLAYDTHLEECYLGQPDDVAKIAGSADNIQQYLQSCDVQTKGHFPESEQNQSILVAYSVSDRQATSTVDGSKGDLDRDPSHAVNESLSISEGLKSTSPDAFEVRKDALSPECGGPEQSGEDLGGSANPPISLHTEDRSGATPGSFQADLANGQNEETIEMSEETREGAIREHALHTAAYPSVSSWTESTETFTSENSLTPNATSTSSNANGEESQIECSQLCAIKEQERSCLLEIYCSNVNTEHIHKNDEVSANMLPSLTDGKESPSAVNTYSQSEDSWMMTPASDEGRANKGQERMSSATDPHWKGESDERSNTGRETERKDPFSLDSMKTILPFHCDSVFTTHRVHSAHNTETIPFANKEEQAAENLSSTETESQNEGVSESMFFAKEEAERTVSASFSAHVECEKEGLAESISFAVEVNKENIEITVSEHLQSQSDETGEDLSFVEEDDEEDIVTSLFKHRECKKEGAAENIAFARDADEETMAISKSEHIETQNEETKGDIPFVMEGDEKGIVISPSENEESEKEGLAEGASFARKANTEILEISASGYLQCQNEDAEKEDISFVKEDNQNDTVTLCFKQRVYEEEGVEENISFLRPDDEQTFKYSAAEHIGSKKEDPKEDISFVREGDQKAIVISSSQQIDSEIEVVAENIYFSRDDNEETINITTTQHRESRNEDAEEDIPVIKEDDEKNIVISYSQHKESDKDVLVENAPFPRKDNEERMAVPDFQHIENENEEAEEDIPVAKKVDENNIDHPLSVERKNEGAEENISFAMEYNKKTVQTWGSQNIGIQNEKAEKDMAFAKEADNETTAMSCSEHIEVEDEGLAEIIFCDKNNEEEKIVILASEHVESQNKEAEEISIAKEDDMKDNVTVSLEHIEGEKEDVSENISSALNVVEDNNEISLYEHIECKNEEDIAIAEDDDMKYIVTASSEHIEGERDDVAENISFAMNLDEDNNEISVSEPIECQNEEAEDISIAKDDSMKYIVPASFDNIEDEIEDVTENISFDMNLDEDNNEISVFEHIECQNEEADGISIAKEDDMKDTLTASSEQIEGERDVAENISFDMDLDEDNNNISVSEPIECQNEEAEDIFIATYDDMKYIVTASSENIEGEKEDVAGNISFDMNLDEDNNEISVSEPIECQNEEAEDIFIAKYDDIQYIVTASSETIEGEREDVAENISFDLNLDEDNNEISVSEPIECQNEEAEDISIAKDDDMKYIVTTSSENIEGEREDVAENTSFVMNLDEDSNESLISEHTECQNEETEDIFITKYDDMKYIVTAYSENIEGEREDVAENIPFDMNLDEDNNEISVSEPIECQNEEAEDMFIAKYNDMKYIVTASSENIEGEREDVAENISFDMNLDEDNNEISVSEPIECQNEEAEDISIANDDSIKDTVTASSEQIEDKGDVAENTSFVTNLDEDNNESLVSEHTEFQNEEAEDISISKDNGPKDIVTESSENIEHKTEVADFAEDNKSFATVDNEEALQISSSECIESEYAEAEEHIGRRNVVMSTTLSLPQLESLFKCVRSEQPECMMRSDSHRTEHMDILDIQAMETDYNGNKAEITNKETKSQEMWSGTPESLHMGPVEELYISQETASFDDYVLVDPYIGEQVEACTFLSNETPSEGTFGNLYADVNEKCNETVKSERHTSEGTLTAMQETKRGMILDLHNDNVSISCTNKNQNQDSLKVHVEEKLKKDSISSVEVQQNTTESNITSISPKDEITGLVLTKDVVFQQELYIDESPEQQQQILEKPASEASSSSSSSSDVNHHPKTWFINVSAECNMSVGNFPDLPSLDTKELSNNSDFPQPLYRPEASLGPMILISEATDEREERLSDSEELLPPTALLQLQGGKHQQLHQILHSESVSDPKNVETGLSNESVILKCISYKVLYFLLFMMFAVIIYQCDSLLCSVLCFCSMYWLFFEEDTYTESVKKQ